MKIVICSSIDFTNKIKEVSDILMQHNHEVEIPSLARKILAGEISLEEFLNVKERNGDGEFRTTEEDSIKRHYHLIKKADAIVVVNIDKKGIKNYIGGNVFLEIGLAYVLGKTIYLLNPLPEVSYGDELKAMKPIILNNNLDKIG